MKKDLLRKLLAAAGKDGTIEHVISGHQSTGLPSVIVQTADLPGAQPWLFVATTEECARMRSHRHLQPPNFPCDRQPVCFRQWWMDEVPWYDFQHFQGDSPLFVISSMWAETDCNAVSTTVLSSPTSGWTGKKWWKINQKIKKIFVK